MPAKIRMRFWDTESLDPDIKPFVRAFLKNNYGVVIRPGFYRSRIEFEIIAEDDEHWFPSANQFCISESPELIQLFIAAYSWCYRKALKETVEGTSYFTFKPGTLFIGRKLLKGGSWRPVLPEEARRKRKTGGE
jgi:hypothetical protein